MEKYIKAILAVFLFLVIQGIIGLIITLAAIIIVPDIREAAFSGNIDKIMNSSILQISSILSGIVTCPFVYLLGVINIKTCFSIKNIDWKLASIGIVSTIFIAFASNILSEFLNLKDYMGDTFIMMADSFLGIAAIAIIAPIVEEFVFREGITGYLSRNGVKPTGAILFSALLFGLMHMNPAQVPFAAILGIALAIVYYKTGSIVISVIIHIINNSIAVIQMVIYGEEANDITVTGSYGTTTAIILMMVFAAAGILGLYYFWEKHPTPEHKNEDMKFVY